MLIAPFTAGAGTASVSRRVAFALLGYTALTVQVLLLRELMVIWRGNEMSCGVSLSLWLAFTAAGSLTSAWVSRRHTPGPDRFTIGVLALGAAAPLAVLITRAAAGLLGASPGETAALARLIGASAIALAPFTFVSGFMFASAVAEASRAGAAGGRAVADVYVTEACGAAVAGILLNFVLLGRLAPLSIAAIAALAHALVSIWMTLGGHARAAHTAAGARQPTRRRAGRSKVALIAAVAAALGGGAIVLLSPCGARLDEATVAARWRSLGFVGRTESVYGRIVATKSGSQRSLFENGVLAASTPDRLAAEEAVHLTLLQHEAPRSVLLLGGGLGGSIEEALKHPTVETLDYVELDPELIRAAADRFGDSMTAGMESPRVTVSYADARLFVKRAHGDYDAVIVAAPDPVSAQINRFYTVEFFEEASAALAPGGVLGVSVSSAENYVSREQAMLLACLRRSLRSVFDSVVMLPGDPCHFVASTGAGPTRDALVLSKRIDERDLDVVYVRDYYLVDRLQPARAAALDAAVDRETALLNTDLRPTCYFLGVVLWNRRAGDPPSSFFGLHGRLTPASLALLAAAIAVAFAAPALSRRLAPASFRRSVVLSVLIVGTTEISLEIAAIMAFQSLYGYVYQRMALIVAAFMAGLALGGRLGVSAIRRGAGARVFLLLQVAMVGVPPALAAALTALSRLDPASAAPGAALFPILVVASAVLAGFQFPLAGRILTRAGESAASVGGRLYGADLAGSAAGATLTAVFLVPIMGIAGAMAGLALLNAAVVVALVVPLALSREG